ncbi:MAG: hypothetical protein ACE141_09895 [Bryobacteraceae bacterium]
MSASATSWARPAGRGERTLWLRAATHISMLPWLLAAFPVAMMVGSACEWLATGSQTPLLAFFRVHNLLAMTALAALEYALCLVSWRLFQPGEPLRLVWLLFMLAAGFRLAGLMVTSFVSWFAGRGAPAAPSETAVPAAVLRDLAVTVTQPLAAALLAAGLFVVLRLFGKAGLLRKPTVMDGVLLAAGGVLLLVRLLAPLGGVSSQDVPGLWSSALLGLLLLGALLLRRAAVLLHDGLIGRCWGAYVSAIFLVWGGDVGMRIVNLAITPWQYSIVHSCIWLLAGLSFALAPAYQVEAAARCRLRGIE